MYRGPQKGVIPGKDGLRVVAGRQLLHQDPSKAIGIDPLCKN